MSKFGTLLRSQRTLAVNSSYRDPNGPLLLMIDSTASRSRVRASETHASMGRITSPSGGSGARDILGSTSKRWRFGPSSSLGVIPVMPRCCRICSTRSRRTRPSEASLKMVLSIPASATTPSLTAGGMPSFPLQKRQVVESCFFGCRTQMPAPASFEIPQPRDRAKLDEILPAKPHRDQDALR